MGHLATSSAAMVENSHNEIETDQMSMVVPDRTFSDELIDCYISHNQPIFPILHIPSFRAKYEGIWKPDEDSFGSFTEKSTFYAILNVVYAVGCLSSSHQNC